VASVISEKWIVKNEKFKHAEKLCDCINIWVFYHIFNKKQEKLGTDALKHEKIRGYKLLIMDGTVRQYGLDVAGLPGICTKSRRGKILASREFFSGRLPVQN
jgi:hypothetical protein